MESDPAAEAFGKCETEPRDSAHRPPPTPRKPLYKGGKREVPRAGRDRPALRRGGPGGRRQAPTIRPPALSWRSGRSVEAEDALENVEPTGAGHGFLLAIAQHMQDKLAALDSLAAGWRVEAEMPPAARPLAGGLGSFLLDRKIELIEGKE